MQNVNYFAMMKCKIPKFSGLCLVLFKIQNLLSMLWPLEVLLGFFCLLRPKSKIRMTPIWSKKLHGV